MALNFQDKLGDYSEAQVDLLCGKHAINNILQEEKLVWDTENPLLVNTTLTKKDGTKIEFTSPIQHKQVKINLYKFCELYPSRLAASSGQSPENAARTLTVRDKCNMIKGMIPFEGLGFILKDLNFRPEYERRLTEASIVKMTKPDNLLGVIFNLGEGHYTALSKFLRKCKSWTRNETKRLTSVSYSYMDSASANIIECLSNAQLFPFLNKLPISAILYVYHFPGSYESLSVKRATQLSKALESAPVSQKAATGKQGGKRKNNRKQTRKC